MWNQGAKMGMPGDLFCWAIYPPWHRSMVIIAVLERLPECELSRIRFGNPPGEDGMLSFSGSESTLLFPLRGCAQ
jgi:hypothetical protein